MTTNTTKPTARTRKPAASKAEKVTPTPEPTVAPVTVEATEVSTPTASYTIPTFDSSTDIDAYVSQVGEAYKAADVSLKAAIRKAWAKFQSVALDALDVPKLDLVRRVNKDALVSSRPVVEVNPTDAYVLHIMALRQAEQVLRAKFGEDHTDRVTELNDRVNAFWDNPSDDDQSAVSSLSAKLGVVKSGNRRTGPARSIESHIRSALTAAPAGTILTCAQVAAHKSDEYGDEHPSVGAVGAAYGREMSGIESTTNAAKTKGYKLA